MRFLHIYILTNKFNVSKIVTQRHIVEEFVGCQVDVVNNLSQVLVEVSVGQVLQVVQRILGNVTLPMEFACKKIRLNSIYDPIF